MKYISINITSAYNAFNDFVEIVTINLIVGAPLLILKANNVRNIIVNDKMLIKVVDRIADLYVLNNKKKILPPVAL